MKMINSEVNMIDRINTPYVMRRLEDAARVCYASGHLVKEGSAERLIRSCIKRGHESILEHEKVSFYIVCDRGVSHELVRHRIASYSQESTRYVPYTELTVIRPAEWEHMRGETRVRFCLAMEYAENSYILMRDSGASPQEARAVLPTATATRLVMTANLREWRHFLKLRCDKSAHPDMRRIALMILDDLYQVLPVVFDDLYGEYRGIAEEAQ